MYLTEADFIPRQTGRPLAGHRDDDGWLLTVGYNATSDQSSMLLFDARTLSMVDSYSLGFVVPFHAHGISCSYLCIP